MPSSATRALPAFGSALQSLATARTAFSSSSCANEQNAAVSEAAASEKESQKEKDGHGRRRRTYIVARQTGNGAQQAHARGLDDRLGRLLPTTDAGQEPNGTCAGSLAERDQGSESVE